MKSPTLIYEFANVHGGNPKAVFALIDALADIPYPDRGAKFHPIAAETLALPDFSYYSVYKKVAIPNTDWAQIIAHAHAVLGSVWIELADLNAFRVLSDNFHNVAGIKLQTSILENAEVFSALKTLNLSAHKVILNVSGQEVAAIETVLDRFGPLQIGRLVLQVGFQGYPTAVEDTSLNKLAVLRSAFGGIDLSLADHLDGSDPFARRVPLLAAALGCSIIEKHVCLDRKTAPFDGSAALEVTEVAELTRELALTARCFAEQFIVPAEAAYLAKTLQRPVTRTELSAGTLVAPEDVLFRRTDAVGLSMLELTELQKCFQILGASVPAKTPLREGNFRPAHIAAIVAARMKSSRLPEKALLPVAGKASVDRCLENCVRFPQVDTVVLATSTHPDDDVLANHTLDGQVEFWRGEEDDVIRRYLGACDYHSIDVVVRVTADCLTMSPEVTDLLLQGHFASGADYTRARRETLGSAPQIFNVEALRRINALTGGARQSEYMNLYVENNPDLFKIHWVDLPDTLVRSYRLTLDYVEDLQMYEALFTELTARGLTGDLLNVISVLDRHPDIAHLNEKHVPVYASGGQLLEQLRLATRITVAE